MHDYKNHVNELMIRLRQINLNVNSEDDFQNILEILMGITMKAAIDVYNHPKEKEHFMKRYQDKINLVKYGIVKKEVK